MHGDTVTYIIAFMVYFMAIAPIAGPSIFLLLWITGFVNIEDVSVIPMLIIAITTWISVITYLAMKFEITFLKIKGD